MHMRIVIITCAITCVHSYYKCNALQMQCITNAMHYKNALQMQLILYTTQLNDVATNTIVGLDHIAKP